MKFLKAIRYAAWGAVVLATPLAFALVVGWWQVDGPGRPAGDQSSMSTSSTDSTIPLSASTTEA